MDGHVKTVKLSDAKMILSALVEDAAQGRPTTITRRGVAVAVLAPIEAPGKLHPQKARSFAKHLLSFPGGVEFERSASSPRDVDLLRRIPVNPFARTLSFPAGRRPDRESRANSRRLGLLWILDRARCARRE
jgi:prevent-host-death family protein